MKLPNRENAQVPKEKLLNYLLSESHPVGRSKAKYFRKLGFNETNIDKLEVEFLKIVYKNEVDEMKETAYGINYLIRGQIKSTKGVIAAVKTIWFVESEGASPRFITAIPDIIITRKAKK